MLYWVTYGAAPRPACTRKASYKLRRIHSGLNYSAALRRVPQWPASPPCCSLFRSDASFKLTYYYGRNGSITKNMVVGHSDALLQVCGLNLRRTLKYCFLLGLGYIRSLKPSALTTAWHDSAHIRSRLGRMVTSPTRPWLPHWEAAVWMQRERPSCLRTNARRTHSRCVRTNECLTYPP